MEEGPTADGFADSIDPAALAELTQRIPIGLVIMSGDATVQWVNDTVTEILRADRADIVGTSVFDWVHPEDHELTILAMAMAEARPDAVQPATYRAIRKDGTEIPVETMGSLWLGPDGERVMYAAIVPVDYRAGTEAAYGALASGRPFAEVLEILVDTMRASLVLTTIVAVYDESGERVATGEAVPPDLWEFVDQLTFPDGEDDVVITDLRELPAPVTRAAELAGHGAVSIVRIADPGGGRPAFLISWAPDELFAHRASVRIRRSFGTLFALALQRRADVRALEDAARSDPLTGIANRLAFVERLEGLSDAQGRSAMLFIDLDDFKPVNDRHGHAVGDRMLEAVSKRIAGAVRDDDFVARIGGDEFAVLCPGLESGDMALTIAERILTALEAPVEVDGLQFHAGASIGIALDEEGATDHRVLLDRADTAMYAAKRAGKGRAIIADRGSLGG